MQYSLYICACTYIYIHNICDNNKGAINLRRGHSEGLKEGTQEGVK